MAQSNAQNSGESYALTHIIIIFGCLAIFIVSNLYIMIPVLEDVAATFTIQTSKASLSISIFSFFYAFGLIFFGSLAERIGLKETICIGLVLLILLMAVCIFVNGFWLFVIIRGLQGFWAASFAPVSFIFVLNVLKRNHQGIVIGVINTGFLSAGVIGQLLSSAVNIFFPWQTTFTALAILYTVLFFYAMQKLPRPRKSQNPRSLSSIINTLIKLPFHTKLKRLYFITFTILLSFVAYYTALESYFTHELHLSTQAALVIRGFGLIGLLITIYFDRISRRLGFEITILTGLTLQLIGLALSASSTIYLITVGSVIFVMGVSLVIPAVIQLIGMNSGDDRSLAISLYSFVLLLGASFGSGIILISNYYVKLIVLFALLLFSMSCAYSAIKNRFN